MLVIADFGPEPKVDGVGKPWTGPMIRDYKETERYWAHEFHALSGNLALVVVGIGIIFAFLLYYYRALDPVEAREQFPGVHTFLRHKWYFDEIYSAVVVRPSLVVAHWFKAFDLWVIDGA